ncbi:MAG: hypothetical protein JWP87_1104 [Labilithrix sp.]|nr:hypothetical protein [Labilithrix sp.]
MSTEPENKSSLLAPLEDAYEPSQDDADRVFAKIQASLLAAPASPSAPPARALPKAAALGGRNLLIVSASCVLLALIGAVISRSRGGDHAPVPTLAPPSPPADVAAPRGEASGAARAAPAVTSIPSISVDALPSASAARPASPSAITSAAAPAADTLEREARLLADARRAVQRGDNTRALALLDEHARVFPKGWLASDRAAEHIVVLCNLGRRAEAKAEATVFLAGRAESPLTRRVATSCAGQP